MKLAINYSRQAAALLAGNRIRLDRFKCPNWLDLVNEASQYCPVAVHFDLQAGNGSVEQDTDWQKIDHLLEQTGTPYVNLHLNARQKDLPGYAGEPFSDEQTQQVVGMLLADVSAAVKRYGSQRVIVENILYRGPDWETLRPAVEPAVIHHILDETGCGLLLDISHARIPAHHLGVDERRYMSQLPVDRVRELHFTGLHTVNGRLQDHLEILESDWPVLDWALQQIQEGKWSTPWMLAFEYGGVGEKFAWRSDSRVMAEQAPILYSRVEHV